MQKYIAVSDWNVITQNADIHGKLLCACCTFLDASKHLQIGEFSQALPARVKPDDSILFL